MEEAPPPLPVSSITVTLPFSSRSSSPLPAPPSAPPSALEAAAASYAARWRGVPSRVRPPRASLPEAAWAFAGCCAGIGSLALLHTFLALPAGLALLTPAFAASAVLLYGVPSSPLGQPRNVVLGHAGSALVGVSLRQLIVALPAWPAAAPVTQAGAEVLAGTLAVALSTSCMMLCGVTHPPGAATALIAVMGSRAVTDLGFLYIPLVVASALVVVAAALLVNNASGLQGRQYPAFAW